jgi:Ca-activated chloride channel family protein
MKKIKKKIVGLLGIMLCLVVSASTTALSKPVACRVELDRGILPAGKKQRAIIKITLDSPKASKTRKRTLINLSIVLDRSGSMSGEKLEKAKEAAIEALRRLGPRDVFSLVVYDTNVETIVPAQNARNTEWIERRIRTIHAGDSTALFGGVSQGVAEIRKNLKSRYIHRIILLSDGLANVGPSTPADLGRLGSALIKENISVTTVGVGTDYNEDLMTRLSQNSDANAYHVKESKDIPHIFTKELGNIANIIAKKVILNIECPEGVIPISIIGREGRIRGKTIELYLNQLYGEQEKYALIEVEIPESRANEKKKIATARISYQDAVTNKNKDILTHVIALFSAKKEAVKSSINKEVQREYHINLSTINNDNAISLADQGRRKEAIEKFKKSIDKLKKVGKENKDEKLLKKAKELEKQAEILEEEGFTSKNRKAVRYDNYQQRNQQDLEYNW